MIFLSLNGIVHRDLAARNILIGSKLEMKIADFGLSRNITNMEGNEYKKKSDTPLPVRWSPPEALLHGRYTSFSDVWSFGVVLWELFSMGLRPYAELSNLEVIQFVQKGKRMDCPPHCPKIVCFGCF